jgi:hypothetical protein
MPQTTSLPIFRAEYPILARVQKPGNVLWSGTFGITNATWAANNATFTTSAPHGLGVGASVTIAGVNPSGYNGTYTTGAGTTGSTIVVPLTPTPGAYVSGGAASVPSPTFSSAVSANDVPNKPTYSAGTIQMFDVQAEKAVEEISDNPVNPGEAEEEVQEETEEVSPPRKSKK